MFRENGFHLFGKLNILYTWEISKESTVLVQSMNKRIERIQSRILRSRILDPGSDLK